MNDDDVNRTAESWCRLPWPHPHPTAHTCFSRFSTLTWRRDEWWFQTAVHQRCSDKKLFVVYFRSSSSSFLYLTFSFIPTVQENLAKTYTYTVILEMIYVASARRCSISLSTPFYHKTITHNGWITAVYAFWHTLMVTSI